MGNYFSGCLDLFIDHTKISCLDMVKKIRPFTNEELSYHFNFVFNEKYLEEHGFNKDTPVLYHYDKDIEEELSEESKKFEDFLISINFPLDLSEHEYYIDDRDYRTEDSEEQTLTDYMATAIDNIKDRDKIFSDFYITIYTNSKHYMETNCEDSILGIINALRDYRLIIQSAEDDNDLGYIKDEDFTYWRDFVWDESILEKEYERRKYICSGCNKDKGIYNLCDNFKFCERAYNICFQQYAITPNVLEDDE